MAITVNGKQITFTRGDTVKIIVTMMLSDGTEYTPQENDVVSFAMKRKYSDPNDLIRKTIPNDTLMLILTPQETGQLSPGHYVYDIQLAYANGDIDTFINNETIIVTGDIV